MTFDKLTAYTALVESRKKCHLCQGLQNPHDANPEYDVDEIGAWSQWQASLNARILIVGQDWADVNTYLKCQGMEEDDNPTNKNLITLLKSIEVNAKGPESGEKHDDLFLNNAILCLKEGGMQAKTQTGWYENCGKCYLKPLVEIIKPKVIIALGINATNGILYACGLKQISGLKQAVENKAGIRINENTLIFPVFHCGSYGVNINRKLEKQLEDWKKIQKYL